MTISGGPVFWLLATLAVAAVVIFFERRPADAAKVEETPAEPIPETEILPEIEEESEIEVEIETEIGTDEGADVSSISDEEAYDDSEDDSENDPA